MAFTPTTYIDLFGSEAEAIIFYKSLFTNTTLTDDEIKQLLILSYNKIEPIFGEYRNYEVGEDNKRNYDVKKAVCLEANAIEKANADLTNITSGGLNSNIGGNTNITSEKIGNITTTYGNSSNGGLAGLAPQIKSALGLLSTEASIILSRYIRKTYGWAS